MPLLDELCKPALAAALLLIGFSSGSATAHDARPWLDAGLPPDARARLAVRAMTIDEKIGLVHGIMAFVTTDHEGRVVPLPPAAIAGSAGYVPGVPRLGIPALYETDASLGVANPLGLRPGDVATALPASLLLAATFDPRLAYAAGALVGAEAHDKGFNVLLGGGMDLTRDPRNGRNFEYLGEDPWLAGVMAGAAVRGTQDQHVISTVKHFALNANETNRLTLDARIDREGLRESDLLAFEIAIERGHPGAVMCAYNKVNGAYSCGNNWLLNTVLKREWGYRGWVMSDWGAVHGVDDALHGLDQESGQQLDPEVWFNAPLRAALARHEVPAARLDDMVERILRSIFAVGVVEHPPVRRAIDYRAHAAVALDIARKGIVLLKNARAVLPLSAGLRRIAVIGGHANLGVLSGGGSSQVMPSNGAPTRIPVGGTGTMEAFRTELYDPSSPLRAIQRAAPSAAITYDPGAYPEAAAAAAAHADVAIVFATRHELEGYDSPGLELPYGQDAVIDAVARANPHTIVVLETGNPVLMPWLDRVPAVLAVWYPGQAGGQAIADVLFGAADPSGRLPITFPRAASDLPRPALPNLGSALGAAVSVDYTEGADVGYRWYAHRGIRPLFAFGHGLSYTRFTCDHIQVTGGKSLRISFQVHNVGTRAGADVPQVYLTRAAGRPTLRLIGFRRVDLAPGAGRVITLTADPRLLGRFDEAGKSWVIPAGTYALRVGESADELTSGGETALTGSRIPATR